VDNHAFTDYFRKMLQGTLSAEQNALCAGAYKNYKGKNHCAYNIAMSFVNAYDFLKENLSSNEQNWLWSNVHSNEYPNAPWSKTWLRPIFNREVITAGNMNTPHISKYSLARAAKDMRFVATASPGYKMIVQHASSSEQSVNLWSIDTGINGNIFAGDYFKLNEGHLNGKLLTMHIDGLKSSPHKVLKLERQV